MTDLVTAITTALTTAASDASSALIAIVPIALGVMILVWVARKVPGWFKSVAK